MSSGYLLCRGMYSSDDNKEYLIKYLRRIVNILLISLLIYITYNFIKFFISSDFVQYSTTFISGIINLKNLYYGIEGGGMFHLWYIFAMIYIVLLLLIFRTHTNYLFGISIILHGIGIMISYLGIPINVRDALFYGLLYTMIGFYIYKNEDKILLKIECLDLMKLIGIFLLGNVLQIAEAYILNGKTYYISTILVSITLFLIVIKDKNLLKNSEINKVGKKSLGIYILHVLIIDAIYLITTKLHLEYLYITVTWQILFTPLVLIISWKTYHTGISILTDFNKGKRGFNHENRKSY